MTLIKNWRSSVAVLLLSVTGLTLSVRPAQALIPGFQVAGVVMIAASSTLPFLGIPVGCVAAKESANRGGYNALAPLGCFFGALTGFLLGTLLGGLGVVGGVFLLDDPQNLENQLATEPFPRLTEQGQKEIDLTSSEATSYAQERDLINALAQSHSQELAQWAEEQGLDKSVDQKAVLERAARLWDQDVEHGLMSPEARAAISKISGFLVQKMNAQALATR